MSGCMMYDVPMMDVAVCCAGRSSAVEDEGGEGARKKLGSDTLYKKGVAMSSM